MRQVRALCAVALAAVILPSLWSVAAAAAPPGAATEAPPAAPPTAPAAAARTSLEGLWMGRSEGAPPLEGLVLLNFSKVGEEWQAEVSIPHRMVLRQALREVKVADGRRFEGELAGGGSTLHFRGELDPAGAVLKGQFEFNLPGGEQRVGPYSLAPAVAARSVPGHAVYTGVLNAAGAKIPMSVVLGDAGPLGWMGSIDIQTQGLTDFPAQVTTGEGGSFAISIPVPAPAQLDLASKEGGKVLEGTFKQGGFAGPISLSRAEGAAAAKAGRPQEPTPPFPYQSRELLVRCPEGHVLAGTLTIPETATLEAPVPGVILLTGSGLQDRNEAIMGHKPFLVIADALTRAGVAVFRCDDRGFGHSTGDPTSATSLDFASDAQAMLKTLRSQPEVDPRLCGIIGHSEGGLTGPIAALREQEAKRPVVFIVMLAGPGVSGREILRVQMKRLLAAEKVPAERVDDIAAIHSRLLDGIIAEMPQSELARVCAELVTAQEGTAASLAGQPAPAAADPESAAVKAAMAQLNSPWMRTFLTLEPREALSKVNAPILAMDGTLDTQVDAEQNLPAIERIRSDAKLPITTRRYEKLNHLFQPAESGSIAEYAQIETTFDPKALAEMVQWVKETSAAAAKSLPAEFKPARTRDRQP